MHEKCSWVVLLISTLSEFGSLKREMSSEVQFSKKISKEKKDQHKVFYPEQVTPIAESNDDSRIE